MFAWLLLAFPSTLFAAGHDLVIRGGRVLDPATGLDAIRNVGIKDGTITAVTADELEGARTIDGDGLVVAPGFIDMNTYQHGDPFFRLRAADGVTAVLHLEDGAVDVDSYYESLEGKSLIHHGVAAGHGSLRPFAQGAGSHFEVAGGMVVGRKEDGATAGLAVAPGVYDTGDSLEYRNLTPDELDSLAALVDRQLRAGAVAVGYGLEYVPGATHTEVLRLVKLAARYDAPSHFHVRGYHAEREWGDLFEMFGAALHAGGDIHVNHLNSSFGSFSGDALAFIDSARAHGLSITAEVYPYTAGLTFIESALFDDWESWSDDEFTRYEWPETGERLTRASFAKYRARGGVVVIHARDREKRERAIRTILGHPLAMIASDGAWDGGVTHPRSAGTNSRILGRYVREEGVLTLMDAVRRMSYAPARHLAQRVPGMANKGKVQPGADADLVLFDPETVIDNATYSDCLLPPTGIMYVLVRGVPVIEEGVVVEDVYPGEAIRGPTGPPLE